jgi:hypothetical protein
MNWIQRNLKTIIYISFLVPIISVAIVSISHVTTWFGITNPSSWSLYLSIGIEIAALSALAAISAQMGKKVYVPFGIVTLIQFIGNIFFAYQYIDISSKLFLDWVDLVDPLVEFLGIESSDIISHKRFLAFFSGGMLPLISLSFLHMLVKFEEEEKIKRALIKDEPKDNLIVEDNKSNLITSTDDLDDNTKELLSKEIGKIENEIDNERFIPSEELLNKLQIELEKLNKSKFINTEEVQQEEQQEVQQEQEQNIQDTNQENEQEIVEDKVEEVDKNEQLIKRLNYFKRDA